MFDKVKTLVFNKLDISKMRIELYAAFIAILLSTLISKPVIAISAALHTYGAS